MRERFAKSPPHPACTRTVLGRFSCRFRCRRQYTALCLRSTSRPLFFSREGGMWRCPKNPRDPPSVQIHPTRLNVMCGFEDDLGYHSRRRLLCLSRPLSNGQTPIRSVTSRSFPSCELEPQACGIGLSFTIRFSKFALIRSATTRHPKQRVRKNNRESFSAVAGYRVSIRRAPLSSEATLSTHGRLPGGPRNRC